MQPRTKRITITVPEDLLASAQRAVQEGIVKSISSYFAAAARENEANETMRQVLDEWDAELGPVPAQVADEVDEQWRQAGVDPDNAARQRPAKKGRGTAKKAASTKTAAKPRRTPVRSVRTGQRRAG